MFAHNNLYFRSSFSRRSLYLTTLKRTIVIRKYLTQMNQQVIKYDLENNQQKFQSTIFSEDSKYLIFSFYKIFFEFDQKYFTWDEDRSLSNTTLDFVFFQFYLSYCKLIPLFQESLAKLSETKLLFQYLKNAALKPLLLKLFSFMKSTLSIDFSNYKQIKFIGGQLQNIQLQQSPLNKSQILENQKNILPCPYFLNRLIRLCKIYSREVNNKIKMLLETIKQMPYNNDTQQVIDEVILRNFKKQLSTLIEDYVKQKQRIKYTCLNCQKSYQHYKLMKHMKICKQKYQQQRILQSNFKAILPKLKDVQGILAKVQRLFKQKSKQAQQNRQVKSKFFFNKQLSKSQTYNNTKVQNQFDNTNNSQNQDEQKQLQNIKQTKNSKKLIQLDSKELKQLIKILQKIIDVSQKIKITRQSTNLILIYDLREIKLSIQQKFNNLNVDCPQIKILIKLLIERQNCLQNIKKNKNKAKQSGFQTQQQYISLENLEVNRIHTEPKKGLKFKKKKNHELDDLYYSQQQITSPSAKYFQQTNQIRLDQFQILRSIGNGKYASVYLVRKKTTNQQYAMKKLQIQNYKEYYQKNIINQKLLNQQRVFETTDNPFVVKAFYSFSQDQYHYFIMEYCPNGDFAELLKNQVRLNQNQARLYFAQIIMALQYLHSQQIIHRDLKPHNIVLDYKWHAKLTDYGLSDAGIRNKQIQCLQPRNLSKFQLQSLQYKKKIQNDDINKKKIVGSPYYMAPQIIRGDPATFASDWWSFGIIVYQTLIGLPPFLGNNREQIQQSIFKNDLWPSCVQFGDQQDMISYEAKDLIERLLQIDPEKRLGNKVRQLKQHSFFEGFDWQKILSMQPPTLSYREQARQNQYESNSVILEDIKSVKSSMSRQLVIRRDHLNNDTQLKYKAREQLYQKLRIFSKYLKGQSLLNDSLLQE